MAWPALAQNSIDSIGLYLNPNDPKPSQSVLATVSSSNHNINLLNVSWSLDGKLMKSGIGEKNFSFTAPPVGGSKQVLVVVTMANGTKVEKTQTIKFDGEIDLIWESVDGYTPPFYRGKTLPIKQGIIRVSAIPNVKDGKGINISAKNFVYTWTKDGKNLAPQSGFGKNSMIFGNQILDRNNQIDVSVASSEKTAKASIVVPLFEPEIVFYEYNQLRGAPNYSKAFTGNTSIKQPRITLVAEPYFLAKDWYTGNSIVMNWRLNNQPASAGDKNTLGVITDKPGVINVSLEYNEEKKLFRKFTESLKLNVQ